MNCTKTSALLSLLRRQWVTPLIALERVRIMSLSQRVSRWRAQGYEFHQRTVTTPSGSRVSAYKLAKAPEA